MTHQKINKFKNKAFIFTITSCLLFSNCEEPFLKSNPKTIQNNIFVPTSLTTEESLNDPQRSGVACNSTAERKLSVDVLEEINIPNNLPENYDLSSDMPPVRSQGNQGSCVAWATSYYLKSYQEKIQDNYQYLSYEDVMSPAFVYNQSKVTENCNSGSTIIRALDVLKESGVNNWKDFPYSDEVCSNLPTAELLNAASQNKIKEYFKIDISSASSDPNYTLINVVKTLVQDKNPIIISLDWQNISFETRNLELVATKAKAVRTPACGHVVLIVGYSNTLKAFKVINSWGTKWGNKGYGWIHYDFFLPTNNSNHQEGFEEAYIAYDED